MADKPKGVMTAILLERPANVDYRLLTERVGKILEFNLEAAERHEPIFPMMLPAGGDLIVGMKIDVPYPDPLNSLAHSPTGGPTRWRMSRAARPT
jgi:hypothetical protein